MLGGRRRRVEVGDLEQVRGFRRERCGAVDLQGGTDVQQLARVQQPPAGIVIHPLTGHDHRRLVRQVRGPGVDTVAGRVEGLAGPGACPAPGRAVQHVQLMGGRVAQRPQVGRGDEHQVERVHGQPGADPADRGRQAGGHVAAVAPGLCGDQREDPFAVRLAGDQSGRAQVGQAPVQLAESLHHAVVREQPPILLERVGVGHRVRAGAGVPDVGHERGTPQVLRRRRELRVLPGRDGLLADLRLGRRPEHADPGAVRVAVALRPQAVRGVDKPERRRHILRASVQSEQTAHGSRLPEVAQGNKEFTRPP